MKYSILIIAVECHYSHITRFITNLKQANPDAEIHLFTDVADSKMPNEIRDSVDKIFYQNLAFKRNYWGVIQKIDALRKHFRLMSKKYRYDIIDIQFPLFYMAFLMRFFKKMSKRIVVTPWGSDILRVNGYRLKILFAGVLAKCDYITTAIDGNIGRRILTYLPKSKTKFYPQAWGSETIDYIDEHVHELNPPEAKMHFGLSNRYVITCGYNAFPAQQHSAIIDAINSVRQSLPDNLSLLFPVSYGYEGKEKYVSKLKDKCHELGIDAVFVEDYLTVSDISKLRMATDMFIHAQTTDAGCASLQEYILCNKKVVHGNWIHYPMLERFSPLCYFPAPSLSALGEAIIKAYHSDPIDYSKDVLEYIKSNGWAVRRKEWNDMFTKITQSN